jgi:hypothetical protein
MTKASWAAHWARRAILPWTQLSPWNESAEQTSRTVSKGKYHCTRISLDSGKTNWLERATTTVDKHLKQFQKISPMQQVTSLSIARRSTESRVSFIHSLLKKQPAHTLRRIQYKKSTANNEDTTSDVARIPQTTRFIITIARHGSNDGLSITNKRYYCGKLLPQSRKMLHAQSTRSTEHP